VFDDLAHIQAGIKNHLSKQITEPVSINSSKDAGVQKDAHHE